MRRRRDNHIVDRLVEKQHQLEKLKPSKPSLSKPEEKKKKEDNDMLWLAAFFIIGLPLMATLYGGMIVWQRSQLAEYGVVVTGTVVEHRSEYYDGEFLTVQYYVFDLAGNLISYTQELSVSEEQYNSLPIGTLVDVIYLPDNPNVSDIYGNETTVMTTKIAIRLRNNMLIASISGVVIGVGLLALDGVIRTKKKTKP